MGMPASSSTLSIDEFTALVAAALSNIDCGQARTGRDHHINLIDGQERSQTPPPTTIPVNPPPLLSWRHKKPKFESWFTSNAPFRASATHRSTEYGDTALTTPSLNIGNYFNISRRKPQATRMTACTSEPTVLAASMSTVDFGNCLGLGGGCAGSCAGTSSSSRTTASPVCNRNTGGYVSTVNTNAHPTPTIPVFTLEVEEDARSNGGGIDLEPTVIGLSSSLRLPQTPSLFRKSTPDLRIHDQCQRREAPRAPRKSFFSKLKKQLSSKASDSHSSTPPPTISFPKSNTAHSDSSPTGLFKLHLSLPLTPLSLSTPASPNPSRSPSPRFPFRAISGSYKRESAPAATNVVLEKPPSNNWSPNLSPIDCPAFPSREETKRIHSLHDYNYAPANPKDSSPSGTIAKDLQEQSLEYGEQPVETNKHDKSNSILSLADCLTGKGCAQMNWITGEPNRPKSNKTNSVPKGSGIREHSGRSSQPFPAFSPPDSDGALSEPSKYSCESAPRSVRMSLSTRNGTNNETQATISSANRVVFPVGPKSEPPQVQLPPQTSFPAAPNHPPELEKEPVSYAPFVPLVFQHERLQQKLQKPVPLTSMPAEDCDTVACIKSIALKPFPPRTTSLSSGIHVRQRTKSAPNASHDEKFKSKHDPAIPIPMPPSHLASVSTIVRNQPGTSMPPFKRDRKVERPTTAPTNSTSSSTFPFKANGGVIPFPVVKETELVGEESVDPERQRKSSKLRRADPRKSLLSPLQPSASSPPARLPSALQSAENMNDHSNSHREGDRTGSIGLNYSLSLSKHPYAQARSSEGILSSPDESDAKATRPSKTSVTFVPSTIDGDSSRLQSPTKAQRHFKTAQNFMPPSPTSPTSPTSNSGSGSGSDASTKSPVTPRSPLFWTVGGAASIAAAVKSRIGLGISGSTPTSGSEECNISAERMAYRDSTINGNSVVVSTSDDAGRSTKEYNPPHPYSRSYLTTSGRALTKEEENSTNDASPSKENQISHRRGVVDDRPSTASSINHRPSMQTTSHHGVAPSKPPPVGPLPFLPDAVQGKSGSEGPKLCDNLGEVPPSPVPSEYIKAFSHPSTRTESNDDDDDDLVSHPRTRPSYDPSQSSESHEHDPEYEALLAANTRANVGELASMRRIGVGRRLMSGHPHPPSSRIDPTSSTNEGKRKRVHSEAARHSGIGGEWTLFLGNDDTPPRREDIIADLSSVPMTGIKTLSGVRARTKSESALKSLGLGHKRSCGMKRATSSTLAAGPSAQAPPPSLPPVPRLVKKQILKSDDWTLSLPLLPPDEKDTRKSSATDTDFSRTRRISSVSPIRGAKLPTLYPKPEVVVCVEGVEMGDDFNLDDTDDMTIAESQVLDTPFGLDIDSLDLEDDDSLHNFSLNSVSPSLDHLLFSVPRVVSKGSGIESAKWGEEVDEEIMKKKGRRLSDGFDNLRGMAGVSVRVDVNEDGESVCIADGLSLNTEEIENGSEEGWRMEGHESADRDISDATKENLARLDALSADLKRFNDLLKEGLSSTTAVELKHARSCGLLPSQTEAKSEHLKVQQSLEALRDLCANSATTKPTLGASVKDRVKSWAERSASLSGPPNVPVSSSTSSPPSISMKSRPPLPFAPSSPPSYSRQLGRSAALGIGPQISPSPGRSAMGRAMTITTQTKPSHLKTVPAIAAIPDGVVGSGLKVGGNGRVISLSCSSATAPPATSSQSGLLRVITDETKDQRAAVMIVQGTNDVQSEEGNGNGSVLALDTKRNSASSFTSTDSFFTSFSSPSQAPSPPPEDVTSSRSRQDSVSSDCGSGSSSPTPTAISPPGLRIITSSTTNSTRAQSPVDDVYTPSSSAMPTPLASSFPTVPPLPVSLSSLGEDLKTVSRMLAGTFMSKNKTTREADKPVVRARHPKDCVASGSRLSTASDMSVRTIVAEQQTSQELPSFHPATEAERDVESAYSDSFYSARSSFEA